MLSRRQIWVADALLVVFSVIVFLAMVEGAIAYALSHPELLSSTSRHVQKPLAILRNYHLWIVRPAVQYLPECAVYDPQVTYTLKPSGRCTIANPEFTVEYAANRAGVRDDDASLNKPVIVVAGDSYAMGWGVAQDAAFPKLLQRHLGLRVLNTGVSSYGTARELALVERLGVGDFKALVIQYSDNDFDENRYLIDKGQLDIMSEARYRDVVAEHQRGTRYFPFKYVWNLPRFAVPLIPWGKQPPPPPDTNEDEARYFLDVLLKHLALVQGKMVVVLELNDYNRNDDRFTGAVARQLADPRFASLRPIVSVVDVSNVLTSADYYLLDDHMRPSGHARVAKVIEDELRRRGIVAAKQD